MISNKLFLLILLVVSTATTVKAKTKNNVIIAEWVNEKKDTIFLIFKKESKYFEKAFWETGGEEKYVKN
ncbi:hypothetical protein [Flavobacterium sp.]|jgi:hypothetical protein|uniref:hypothetical protein n=1 Tax=Flavobacterium sp. TaxID=239 RepID=UPI0037C0C74A